MEILYFETTDEVTKAIERIEEASEKEVAIVLPQGSLILQSIVNLKLLAKTAKEQKKDLVVVTIDKIGRNLAMQVGIPVYGKIDKGKVSGKLMQKTPQPVTPSALRDQVQKETEEITTVTGIQVHRYDNSDKLSQLDERDGKSETAPADALENPAGFTKTTVTHLRDASGRMAQSSTFKIPPRIWKTVIYIMIIAAIVATGLLYWFFPKTIVTITLMGEKEQIEETLNAISPEQEKDGDIDLIITSTNKSGEKEFAATGTRNIGEKASGSVTLVNDYSTSSQSIPAGTVLRASDGKQFVLSANATIPGADISVEGTSTKLNSSGTTKASITAEEAGDSHNIKGGRMTLVGISESKDGKVYATEPETSGGTSETLKIVSQEDIDNAKNSLVEELTNQAKADAVSEAAAGFVFEEATAVSVIAFESSVGANTEQEKFISKAEVEAKVLAIDKQQLSQYLATLTSSNLDSNKELKIADDTLEISLSSLNLNQGQLVLKVKAVGTIVTKIDLNDVKSQLIGKNQGRARTAVEQLPQFKDVIFKYDPTWYFRRLAPSNSSTELKVEYVFEDNENSEE